MKYKNSYYLRLFAILVAIAMFVAPSSVSAREVLSFENITAGADALSNPEADNAGLSSFAPMRITKTIETVEPEFPAAVSSGWPPQRELSIKDEIAANNKIPDLIWFRAAKFRSSEGLPPPIAPELEFTGYSRDFGYYVVQFDGETTEERKAEIL